FPKDFSTDGLLGTTEGTELKNETNVNGQTETDPNGDNGYDFAGLLAGCRLYTGAFYYRGTYGIWWSSSGSGSDAWYRNVYSYLAGVYRDDFTKACGFAVRCVQD
ncbi:MAG: hypothetical protein U9R06_00120, partial [Patescibacteria group bacterium]|nr:hypothetical protein [Patescibacteria group bacterium]